MRKFYLENSAGERRDLNGQNGVFFKDPTGLGITLARSYADLGHGFFKPISTTAEPQTQPGGTLVFHGPDPYADYRNLINWMSDSEDLVLVYLPFGTEEYYRRVDINYLSKGELTLVRWLEVPASFSILTPWYRPAPSRLTLATTQGRELRYTYRYTEDLIYGSSSAATMSADIAKGGHVPAAVKISYTGSILNPRITLKGAASGDTYGVCSLAVSLGASDTLEFSTLNQDSYVRIRSATGIVTDLLDVVDLSIEPFFRVPLNEPCTLEITADDVFTGTADLQIYYYYRSV